MFSRKDLCKRGYGLHCVSPLRYAEVVTPAYLCSVTSVVSDSVTPWTVTHWAPLSMRFPRQEYWSGLPCPPPGDLPVPGIELASSASPALQAASLPTEPPGKPHNP